MAVTKCPEGYVAYYVYLYKSAITGFFVKKTYAELNPTTTVKQRVRRFKLKKLKK